MLKFKKLITCFLLTIMLFSSSVLATNTDIMPITEEPTITIEENDSTNNVITTNSISKDLYIYNTESYTLNDIVYGNIFASTTKFVTNPRNNGGLISGNLFVLSNEVTIGSDVTYSNNQDKNGNYIISSINSKSIIQGNVYAFTDSFTLEAGSVIEGDLYVASTNVNIEQDAVINGNVFITASNVSMNGQVAGSAYITSDKFDMSYLAYITRDLYLNSENATLAGVVYRNAFVTTYNKLTTTSYFRVDQNLSVDYANDFTFSGEIKGNAVINAKNLSFKNDTNEKCIINGNLDYATKTEITIPDGIVSGELKNFEFIELYNNEFSIADAMFNFIVIFVYVFVVVLLSRLIAPKAIEKIAKLNIKNALISFAIGFASLVTIVLAFLFLLISGAGIALGFLLVIAYLFVFGLALPYLLYNIANMFKLNLHLYVKLLIVTAVYYLISLIPVISSYFVFITLLVGVGRILISLFSKKK